MPIRFMEAPPTAFEAVDTTVRALIARSPIATPALRTADAGRITIDTPHEVFALGLADLLAGADLDAARPVGWRYLVREDGRPIALAQAAMPREGGGHVFSHVNEGPYVASTGRAIADLERLEEARDVDFDVRVLEVPALYCTALWLRRSGGELADLIIPLAPAPTGLEPGRPLRATEFLAALAQEAKRAGIGTGPDSGGEA